jgi:simple sugar transport system ATP-binding protein
VHEVADRLVILDRGKVVREIQKGELSLAELTRQMIALHEEHADGRA